MRRVRICRGWWIILAGSALAVSGGCGHNGPEIVTVKGTITYGGGAWPTKGMLYFTPIQVAEGFPRVSGYADFDKDGDFQVVSSSNAGLVPGRYGVSVECWRIPPKGPTKRPDPNASYVPAKFQSSGASGLVLDIQPGRSVTDVRWDVPKK
jgi:hypothetical protein